MNTNKIAIDIVLLPDEKTEKIARELNKKCNGEIDFTNTGKVPHISLLMGIIDKSDLKKLFAKLEELKDVDYSGNAEFENYFSEPLGKYTPSLILEKNTELENIFIKLQEKIKPLFSYDLVTDSMFFESNNINKKTHGWVFGFKDRVINEYGAHITLGISEKEILCKKLIPKVNSSKIAVFQLGTYCTCSNKLFEKNNEQ